MEPLDVVEETTAPVVSAAVEEVMERTEEVSEGAAQTAVVASLAGAGAAAGPALRLVVAGGPCKISQPLNERQYPMALHPTRISLFGSEAAGVVVGNFAITVGFSLLAFLVVKTVSLAGCFASTLDTLGLCRFPSAPLFVFQYLLQGTALGAMALVFYPPSIALFLLGALTLFACVVVPCFVLREVTRGVPTQGYYLNDETTKDRRYLNALIGPGEWVSRQEKNMWSLRYASVTRQYRESWACYGFVDMSASLVIAAVQGPSTDTMTGCGHQKVFYGVVFLVLLTAEAVAWPRARTRDNYIMSAMLATQSFGMFLMGVGYYKGNPDSWVFVTASWLMMGAAGIMMIKVVLDIGAEGYILFSKRRGRLGALSLAQNSAGSGCTIEVELVASEASLPLPCERHTSESILQDSSFSLEEPLGLSTPLTARRVQSFNAKGTGGGGGGSKSLGRSMALASLPSSSLSRPQVGVPV